MSKMMELDGLADIDALFGIAGLKEDLMDVAVLGLSAGVSVVAGEMFFAKVPKVRDLGMGAKAGIAIALGIGGSLAISRYGGGSSVMKGIAAGVGAGLVGWGVTKGAVMLAAKAGYPLAQVSDRDLLLGMGVVDNDVTVSDYRPLPGQTNGVTDNDIEVSDYRPLPGQTNGMGQAGDVYTRDLQPMPGQSGSSGYASLGSFIS